MKFRITSLLVLLSLVVSACSLAEDITPPPGYQYPTAAPSLAATTTTSVAIPSNAATPTIQSVTNTPEETPAGTTLAQTPGTSSTPAAAIGNISGTLVNGSGGALPDGQKVTLEGFDEDQTGTYQKSVEIEAPVNPDGSYGFTGVELPINRAFLVITSWQGVEYPSDPIFVTDSSKNFTIPVTIYDKTDNINSLRMDQIHLSFDMSAQNVIQVTELFIVSNPGQQAVFVQSDGTTIPFIQLPVTAGSVQYQMAQGSAQLMNATGGFAMAPGADKQYAFIVTFNMAYSNSLDFEQPFSLPASSLTVFIPQGMRLNSDQLTAAGSQAVQDKTYSMYQANNLASGSSISLTLSGQPGSSTGAGSSQQTMILIGIGMVGILLVGTGIFLYLRDRARVRVYASEADAPAIETDSLGENRDAIMDAMIVLDDQYKAGDIQKEAYEARRAELKDRLKGLL